MNITKFYKLLLKARNDEAALVLVINKIMPMINKYAQNDNKEIDAVIELSNGEWCAFEIKLGANQIDEAAKNLLDVNKKIEKDPKGKPAKVLCVICGLSNAAYKRPDGVYVVPITALKN